ncbi:MAG: hypothetical protein AAF206_28845, partial [Bacteroidota bacterium]
AGSSDSVLGCAAGTTPYFVHIVQVLTIPLIRIPNVNHHWCASFLDAFLQFYYRDIHLQIRI